MSFIVSFLEIALVIKLERSSVDNLPVQHPLVEGHREATVDELAMVEGHCYEST